MSYRISLRFGATCCWLLVAAGAALAQDASGDRSGAEGERWEGRADSGRGEALSDDAPGVGFVDQQSPRILYEVIRERDPRGALQEVSSQGSDEAGDALEIQDRAARPWNHLGEGVVYNSEGWYAVDEAGHVVHGYRVTGLATEPVPPPKRRAGSDKLTPELREHVAGVSPETLVPVLIAIRTAAVEERHIAVPPPVGLADPEEIEAVERARKAASIEKARRFEQLTSALTRDVEILEGRVLGLLSSIGWVAAEVPAAAVKRLADRPEVTQVTLDLMPLEGANPVALGDLRGADFTNAQSFWNAGFNAESGAGRPARIGVTEVTPIEDEVCYLDDYGLGGSDDCDPDERLKGKFTCDAASCSSTSNFLNEDSHGTIVTSIIAADYLQGQGASEFGGLPVGWEGRASGFAKEAQIHYYDGGGESTIVNSLGCAGGDTTLDDDCRKMDITNSSIGWTGGRCNPASQRASEAAVENLWDEGTLPVILAHNQGDHPTCKTISPGDIPKAFTVGALAASSTKDYEDWDIASYSNNGGADIKVGGVLREGTMSITDLVATGNPNYVTSRDSNGVGDVKTSYGGQGTSFATPQVAGAAALVRDWMLALDNNWITYPGRLHVQMLGMGDRGSTKSGGATWPGCLSNGRIKCGADTYFGLGRLKLKRPDLRSTWTHTFTGSTPDPYKQQAFGGLSMPSDTKMVKCVMQQREDMVNADGGGGKDDISLIGLWVKVRSKHNGQCVLGKGTLRFYRWEALYDDKHMVAILDSDVSLGNRCLEVEFDRVYLSSDNYVTTHTFCYSDDQLDY